MAVITPFEAQCRNMGATNYYRIQTKAASTTTRIVDSIAGNNGTIIGTPTFVDNAPFPGTGALDCSAAYTNGWTVDTRFEEAGACTWLVWFYTTAYAAGTNEVIILGRQISGSTNDDYLFYYQNTGAYANGGNTHVGPLTMTHSYLVSALNRWALHGFTRDESNNVSYWINGMLNCSSTHSDQYSIDGPGNYNGGGGGSAFGPWGHIGPMARFGRALTASEMVAAYSAGRPHIPARRRRFTKANA